MEKNNIRDFLLAEDTETKVELINLIIEDALGKFGEERIFDLENSEDCDDFVRLYGEQDAERFQNKARYALGGDNYYTNEANYTYWRCNAVKVLDDKALDTLLTAYLGEWERHYLESLNADGEYSKEEVESDWAEWYGKYIDVYGFTDALGEE